MSRPTSQRKPKNRPTRQRNPNNTPKQGKNTSRDKHIHAPIIKN